MFISLLRENHPTSPLPCWQPMFFCHQDHISSLCLGKASMTKSCEKALFDVFRQLMLFDIFWWALGINLIAPFLADIGFHVPDNDHPFQLWESPWCEQQRLKSMRIGCNVKLNYSAQQIAYWEDLFPKNWDDQVGLIYKGCKFWINKWPSYFITRSHYKTLGTSCLAFVPKRWELWLSEEKLQTTLHKLYETQIEGIWGYDDTDMLTESYPHRK